MKNDDLKYAVELLEKCNYTFVAVKDGVIVYTSRDRGVKPVYDMFTLHINDIKASSIADKVTGNGTARFLIDMDIKGLKTRLISEEALNTISDRFEVIYDKKVPYIKNREKNGMCPVEAMSLKYKDMDQYTLAVKDFLIEKGLLF